MLELGEFLQAIIHLFGGDQDQKIKAGKFFQVDKVYDYLIL